MQKDLFIIITFLDVREEKPYNGHKTRSCKDQLVSQHPVELSDIVELKEYNSSAASTPFHQVLDAILKHQQSIEDLTKTMQAMRSVGPHPTDRSRNHQSAKPKRKCFTSGEGHIA